MYISQHVLIPIIPSVSCLVRGELGRLKEMKKKKKTRKANSREARDLRRIDSRISNAIRSEEMKVGKMGMEQGGGGGGSFLTGRREVKTGLGHAIGSRSGLDSRFFFDRGRARTIRPRMLRVSRQPSGHPRRSCHLRSPTQSHAALSLSLSRYGSPRYRRYDSHGLLRRVSQGPRGEDNEHNESGGDTTEEETK